MKETKKERDGYTKNIKKSMKHYNVAIVYSSPAFPTCYVMPP